MPTGNRLHRNMSQGVTTIARVRSMQRRAKGVAMKELLRLRITGSDSGITGRGDVLTNTADGVDLRAVWQEVQSVIGLYNRERVTVTDLLSFPTTQAAVPVPQSVIPQPMQRASEYGVPKAAAYPPDVLKCGATLDDYDLASRLSYRFLRDATQEQIVHQVNQLLASDRLLTTGLILKRIFDPTEDENEWSHRVFGFYNGDNVVPPRYSQKSFTAPHMHYLPTGANELDSGDIENAFRHITEHGYGRDPSSRLVILCNEDGEGERIQSWRAGVENANAQVARYDFIPSSATPAYLSAENVHGAVPPPEWNGLVVKGSYGPGWLIESPVIPSGWVIVAASGGLNSVTNPIMFRQHTKPAYQGLQIMPGPRPGYPLIESFTFRTCGVGVARRGAAVALYVGSGPYVAPELPAYAE